MKSTFLTQKQLEQLQRDGKIRGYETRELKKGMHQAQAGMKKPKALVWLDWNLAYWCNEKAITMEKEFQFDEIRKWRFDYAMPSVKIAVEYEGGVFLQKSGHNTAKHYNKDTDKYNRAAALGWRIIRVTAMNYTTVLKHLNDLIKK